MRSTAGWARHDNCLCRVLTAPGLWLQNFTTFEPDDSMIEVGIRPLELVLPEAKEERRQKRNACDWGYRSTGAHQRLQHATQWGCLQSSAVRRERRVTWR